MNVLYQQGLSRKIFTPSDSDEQSCENTIYNECSGLQEITRLVKYKQKTITIPRAKESREATEFQSPVNTKTMKEEEPSRCSTCAGIQLLPQMQCQSRKGLGKVL